MKFNDSFPPAVATHLALTDDAAARDQDADTHHVPADWRLDPLAVELLCCPRCGGRVRAEPTRVVCEAAGCERAFPVAEGVPVLVEPEKSIFDWETFTRSEPTFFRPVAAYRRWLSRFLPDLSRNIVAAAEYQRLKMLLAQRGQVANVLVIGGGVVGSGMECLLDDPQIRLIETDVAVAPRTQLICDAHDLPFRSETIDAVIVQAVLEHVVDPQRCVAEIHRVLKPDGLVYADTPFMQQVHGRQFDFTRFTRLGHRRLFRHFEEVSSGISCGPGVALAWSARYFLMSWSDSRRYRAVASAVARGLLWWLKYCDRPLATRRAAQDAASAFFFLGRKSSVPLSDRALVASYVGGQ